MQTPVEKKIQFVIFVFRNNFMILVFSHEKVQVNLFQKHLFLHQLAHNMTTWNYRENYKRRTWAEHEQSVVILWVN